MGANEIAIAEVSTNPLKIIRPSVSMSSWIPGLVELHKRMENRLELH